MEGGDDMKTTLLACDKCGKLLTGEKEHLCIFYCGDLLKLEFLFCPLCRGSFLVPLLQELSKQKEDIKFKIQQQVKSALVKEPKEEQT